jgi:COX assembly protein 2
MRALDECHSQGFMATSLGSCNKLSAELTLCLKDERKDRQRILLEKSREKRKQLEQKWRALDEEEYGKDGYLKNIVAK